MTTSTHHLLGQSGRIDDHRVDPAGLGDERDDRAVVVGDQGAGDALGGRGRAGEGDAGDADVLDQSLRPFPGRRRRAPARPRGCRPHGRGRPRRRRSRGSASAGLATTLLPAASAALTWPRKMASGKFHGAMQTQAPRPSMRSTLRSPVGPGSSFGWSWRARLRGVIAAEVGRLADLGERVGDRLLRLLDAEPHQHVAVALEQVGEPLEAGGALLDAAPPDQSGEGRATRRACHQLAPAAGALGSGAKSERRRRPRAATRSSSGAVVEIEPPAIPALRLEQIVRQRDGRDGGCRRPRRSSPPDRRADRRR